MLRAKKPVDVATAERRARRAARKAAKATKVAPVVAIGADFTPGVVGSGQAASFIDSNGSPSATLELLNSKSSVNGYKKGKKVRAMEELTPAALRFIEGMAEVQCTNEEVAAALRWEQTIFDRVLASHPTLQAILERGRRNGRSSLRRILWGIAQQQDKNAVAAAIFLAKNLLGYRDNRTDEPIKIEHSGPQGEPLAELPMKELVTRISVLFADPAVSKLFGITGESVAALAEQLEAGAA